MPVLARPISEELGHGGTLGGRSTDTSDRQAPRLCQLQGGRYQGPTRARGALLLMMMMILLFVVVCCCFMATEYCNGRGGGGDRRGEILCT